MFPWRVLGMILWWNKKNVLGTDPVLRSVLGAIHLTWFRSPVILWKNSMGSRIFLMSRYGCHGHHTFLGSSLNIKEGDQRVSACFCLGIFGRLFFSDIFQFLSRLIIHTCIEVLASEMNWKIEKVLAVAPALTLSWAWVVLGTLQQQEQKVKFQVQLYRLVLYSPEKCKKENSYFKKFKNNSSTKFGWFLIGQMIQDLKTFLQTTFSTMWNYIWSSTDTNM